MSDWCGDCTCRGDVERCEATDCSEHEGSSWYVRQLKADRDSLKARAEEAEKTEKHALEMEQKALYRLVDTEDERDQLREKNEKLVQMLEDVVNELDLSDSAIAEHGPMGTPPAQLVRLVLEQKDKTIRMLKAGMVDAQPAQEEAPCPKS